MITKVALDHAGLSLSPELSGIVHNHTDWYRLLNLCVAIETFIGNEAHQEND